MFIHEIVLAVQLDKSIWHHYEWKGFIVLETARDFLCDGVFIARFRGVCEYRKEDETSLFYWGQPP